VSTVYLAKANDSVISFCKCKRALIDAPCQFDCPWCGCGWLFSCSTCGKAFTFAKGVQVDEPLEDIGRRALERQPGRSASDEDVDDWVTGMRQMLEDVEVGQTYVYLDGLYLPADSEQVTFDGWAAHHDLPRLPQTLALTDAEVLDKTLGQKTYWTRRKFADAT
jgi:hypothetical protein